MKTSVRLRQNTERYRKTKKGVISNVFSHMKSRNAVEFDNGWFMRMSIRSQKFNRLFSEWEKSKHNKQFKPSIDRINNKKPYTKENIHWLTWAENRYKQTMERRSRKGPVLQLSSSKVVNRYLSQRHAVMKTGLSQSGISMCLNGQRQHCGGYQWEYENK